jgi:hypothetical protein
VGATVLLSIPRVVSVMLHVWEHVVSTAGAAGASPP